MIEDRRDAVVRRDRQKIRLELLAFADIDRNDVIFQSGFLEENRDFMAVRRGPIIDVDHDEPMRRCCVG